MFKIYASAIAILISGAVQAQDSLWTLQRTIKYAVDNNLDIKQSVLNERLSRLQLLQSQLSQLPNASVSADIGRSYGRSIDPTTNQFINQGYTFSGLNGNVDVLLFGWFQKRNTISQNKFLSKAAVADVDQLKDDVSLNVATAFLRILMAKEQIKVQENQLKYSLKAKRANRIFCKGRKIARARSGPDAGAGCNR
jgi:outer membrane protein